MQEEPVPEIAGFEEGRFPVEVIVLWDASGGWHAATVYYVDSGVVTVHPQWSEDVSWVIKPWDYFSERVREGRGGNGYTYDVWGFEVAHADHIAPVVTAWEAEVVAATHGPMGETAGTYLPGQLEEAAKFIPFVVLPDDAGDLCLVGTALLGSVADCRISTEDGVPVHPVPYESIAHWQRNGAPAWPLGPQVRYVVGWAATTYRLVLHLDGRLELAPIAAEASGEVVAGAGEEPETVDFDPVEKHTMDDGVPMLIERVPNPRWMMAEVLPPQVGPAFEAISGEGPGWGDAIPAMYRALASPFTFQRMPQAPDRPEVSPGLVAYWEALLQMLIFSLGWVRPDRGLRWWYDAGRPVDDPRLALLERMWRRDGHLEEFALWLCRHPHIPETVGMVCDLSGCDPNRTPTEPHPDWFAAVRSQGEGAHFAEGDSDPYHLWSHSIAPVWDPPEPGTLLRSGRRERRAVLMVDSMVGWYRALATHGASLPPLANRSWHVDVVVRPAGWLGTYRRSRTTGLWFAGRHRFHTPGT